MRKRRRRNRRRKRKRRRKRRRKKERKRGRKMRKGRRGTEGGGGKQRPGVSKRGANFSEMFGLVLLGGGALFGGAHQSLYSSIAMMWFEPLYFYLRRGDIACTLPAAFPLLSIFRKAMPTFRAFHFPYPWQMAPLKDQRRRLARQVCPEASAPDTCNLALSRPRRSVLYNLPL